MKQHKEFSPDAAHLRFQVGRHAGVNVAGENRQYRTFQQAEQTARRYFQQSQCVQEIIRTDATGDDRLLATLRPGANGKPVLDLTWAGSQFA